MKSALVVAAAVALSGCIKEKFTPAKTSELKLVLNATSPNDTDTRALKPDWVSGDKIVVFFGASASTYATFTYDGSLWVSSDENVTDIGTNGTLQAIHAGSSTFAFDGTNINGIGGDLLFDKTGTYTVDTDTSTAYLTANMARLFTTAIKMQGSADQTTNEKWRLAGQGLWVLDPAKGTSVTATNVTTNPDWAIQQLFSQSNVSGAVAVPDAAFTDGTQAVFHVWDQDSANAGTSLSVFSTDDPTNVYTRAYTSDLVAGQTVIIQSPDSSESGQWTSTTPTPVSSTAVALDGITAPATGATPATTVTESSDEFDAAIAWNPNDNPFNAGTAYTATITLTAAHNYTFTGSGFDTDNTGSVAGFTAGGMAPTGVTNNGSTLVLTYDFAATPTIVTATALTDIVAPVAGATPATTITPGNSDVAAATLSWDGTPATFAEGGTYTATITLTAASGFTFTGGFADAASLANFTTNLTGGSVTYDSSTDNTGTALTFKYTFAKLPLSNHITYAPDEDDVTLN